MNIKDLEWFTDKTEYVAVEVVMNDGSDPTRIVFDHEDLRRLSNEWHTYHLDAMIAALKHRAEL